MGIFGDDTVTSVDTQVVRLVEDDMVPDIGKTSILESVFRGGSATEAMIEKYLNGTQFKKAYNYAKQGHYYFGLPNATILTNKEGASEVKAVLDALTGEDITLEYLEYGALNYTHVGWQALYDDYGYDNTTNEITVLSAQTGFPTYLDMIVPVYFIESLRGDQYFSPGAIDSWGVNSLNGYTPERRASNGQETVRLMPAYEISRLMRAVKIHYIWEANGTIHKDIITLDLAEYPLERSYFQVRYSYTDSLSQVQYGYWTYLDNSGTHPTLDALYNVGYLNPGTYFPFALLRRGDSNRAHSSLHETDEYKTTKKLLKHIGIDYQSFSDALHENPNIGDVDDAVLMMGVPITSTNPIDMEYLYQFFIRLNTQTPYEFEDAVEYRASESYRQYRNGIENRDRRTQDQVTLSPPKAPFAIIFQDAEFKMVLNYGGVIRTTRSGSIGPVGTITNTTSTKSYLTSTYYVPTIPEDEDVSHVGTSVNRIICKQLTPNLYDEIIVIDPIMRYEYSLALWKNVQGNAQNSRLLIPLDMAIAEQFSTKDSVVLFNRSLHLVINARVVQELEWYETGFFKFVLQAIAVVITIVTLGKGAFLISLTAAIGAGLVATTLFLLEYLVYYFLFKEAFKIVVKEIGLEAAMVLAIIAAAYGMAKLQGIGTSINAMMAENLLMTSSGLFLGTREVLSDMFSDLQNEFQAFLDYRDEALKEMEKAQELLKNDYSLQPFVLLGEKPQDFYDRTIHAGNIGILGVQYVETFVEQSLRLPDINDSLNTFGGSYV